MEEQVDRSVEQVVDELMEETRVCEDCGIVFEVSKEHTCVTFYVIGYGIFMTNAMANLDESMDIDMFGASVKILDVVSVEGYRRICQPYSSFPYVIKEEGHSFMGVAFEVRGNNGLERLDRVEGVPHHYTRETVVIDNLKYFIYIPSESTYEHQVKRLHKTDPADFWHERVRMVMNDYSKEKYPDFDIAIDGAEVVQKRFDS